MARIRRQHLPPALLRHLLDRIQQRTISADQLGALATWLDTQPEVPEGKWFKRLPGMTVCGEGELVRTFLTSGQVAEGVEVRWTRRSEPRFAPGFVSASLLEDSSTRLSTFHPEGRADEPDRGPNQEPDFQQIQIQPVSKEEGGADQDASQREPGDDLEDRLHC